jgi:serine protease Do
LICDPFSHRTHLAVHDRENDEDTNTVYDTKQRGKEGLVVESESSNAPARRRGFGYHATVIAVLAVAGLGALLGSTVLPQYLGMHPAFSAQFVPASLAARPTATLQPGPTQVAASQVAPGGTVRVVSEESVVINVVKQVRPAVVNINTESEVQTALGVFPEKGAGSGVIVRPDGYVLTNNHVVQGATNIKVTLIGGKTLTGRIIGRDPLADLAVVKVDTKDPLPAARLGGSANLQVGQLAVAIGNPFGLGSTVTTGVVSALNRRIEQANLVVENLIQTSAAINPGNSGGALVNSAGEVIGINTAIIPNAQGIGFAIPSDVARAEMEQLIANGRVVRPWVGVVYGGDVDAQGAQTHQLGTDHGVLVRDVEPNSPAGHAGLQAGDIITSVNDDRVDTWSQFVHDVVSKKIGETVKITVVRDRSPHTVEVTLAERPGDNR